MTGASTARYWLACLIHTSSMDPDRDTPKMAPSSRPQLSITLPRNFTFHFIDGEEFKTPEPEEVARRAPQPVYRVKRRARASVIPSDAFAWTSLATSVESASGTEDVPLPSIELPISSGQVLPTLLPQVTELQEGYLSPLFAQRTMALPRTPSAQPASLSDDLETSGLKDLGESISRPMSVCSVLSDSSDDSDDGSEDYMSLGGSCTSPESDSGDPFTSAPWKKNVIATNEPGLRSPIGIQGKGKWKAATAKSVNWTSKMDMHLWTCYQIYIQDPTHTPFKLIPGSPPPLGVCHRVTRQARTTWPGEKIPTSVSSDLAHPDVSASKASTNRGGSPDTLKADRSGSTTPTAHPVKKLLSWPKSNSSTRRRLRELCRRKATMPAHYQRLLQSRSPTPFASSSRSHSRSIRPSSSPNGTMQTPTFQTDELQMSLITSTATSMQPNGPLAKLMKSSSTNDEWFNDPNVPWASPAPVPSEIDQPMIDQDLETSLPPFRTPSGSHSWGPVRSRQHTRPTLSSLGSDLDAQGASGRGNNSPGAVEAMVLAGLRAPFGVNTWSPRQSRQHSRPAIPPTQWQFDAEGNSLPDGSNHADEGLSLPRLRSPFGNQTWGPSSSRQSVRPTTPVPQSDVHTQLPEPKTPVRFHGTFPHALNQKRRAQNQLEDEVSPGGTDLNRNMLEDARAVGFSSSRRVRIRGATTGGVNIQELMPDLFRIPNHPTADLTTSSNDDPPRLLASPFGGISPRPALSPRRHGPSLSLPAFDAQAFSSIDQLVHQVVSESTPY